jgi:predicted ribonuclease YlaK
MDDDLKFVTLLGGAGNGKTLLAIAAGILDYLRFVG